MNLIDLIILVLLFLAAVEGIKKGFLRSTFALLSSIIGLFAAIKYNPLVVEWVNEKYALLEKFRLFFAEEFVLPTSIGSINIGTLTLPDIGDYLDSADFSADLKMQLLKYILNLSNEFALTATSTLGEAINLYLSEMAYKTVIFLVMWFLVYKVTFWLSHFFTDAIQFSLANTLDRVGGIVVGVCLLIFVMMVAFGMVYPLLELAGFTEASFFVAIAKSISGAGLVRLFSWLYALLMGEYIVPWL